MKTEELLTIGLTQEQADQVLALSGKDIARYKQQAEDLKADNTDLKSQLEDRDKDIAELKASTASTEEMQKKLTELESKYTTDTEAYQKQLSDRDYSDALARAIADTGVKFSSKAAEKAFVADLMANRLEVKDGALDGFKEYHAKQLEADPAAFAGDKPAPFVKQIGAGQPATTESKFAAAAKSWNGTGFAAPNTKKE